MADKQMYPVNLYDANGQHIATAEHDSDLLAGDMRTAVIEHGGHSYIWDQRNAQWRQASDTVSLGRTAKVETKQPEPAKS